VESQGINKNVKHGRYYYRTSNPFRVKNARGGSKPEPHERAGFKVADVQAAHHQIKRLHFLGYRNTEIAKMMGVSTVMVGTAINSPAVKKDLEVMQGAADVEAVDLKKQVISIAPKALKNVEEVVCQGTLNGQEVQPSSILRESNMLLDRFMGKPTQNIRSESYNAHFTAEEIKDLKSRALARAVDSNEVEEAEVEDAPN